MNGTNTMPRRRALGLLGAATFVTTTLPYAAAVNNKNKSRILFFTKSSGFEHDAVKRKGDDPSLSETTLTELRRSMDSTSSVQRMGEILR